MTNSRGRSLWLSLLAPILMSCVTSGDGSLPSPSLDPGDTSLPFTVVTREGPRAQTQQVLAALTLPALKSQVAAANPPECVSDSARWCWQNVNPPRRSLLIAIFIPRGCVPGQLAGVILKSGGHLMAQVNMRAIDCKPGAGSQPLPSFSLVSVLLDRLPIGLLTVQAHYLGGTIIRGPPSLDAQTTVENSAIANGTPSGGSVRVDSATPPPGEPRELTVSGAVNGTNRVNRQSCESSGTTYRHFTLTTE